MELTTILLGAQVQRALGVSAPPLGLIVRGGVAYRVLPNLTEDWWDEEWHRLAAELLMEEMEG